VVTGCTPEELLAEATARWAASFPVFLHPQTGEEYALARTERKQGHGYHGFAVDAIRAVTLEDDLERRDLTINAMARDAARPADRPVRGRRDIEARLAAPCLVRLSRGPPARVAGGAFRRPLRAAGIPRGIPRPWS
jgi:tRNA nucleotidyltransferase (CCA-adding enzyme)